MSTAILTERTAVLYQTMPPLSTDEYSDLEKSILANGVQVPILLDDHGVVIDGHHRKAIAEQHGLYLPSETRSMLTEAQKIDLSISLNVARRQLNREQKRAIVEASVKAQPEKSNREHAKAIGVDHKTVGAMRDHLESTGEIPQFDKTVGADGKERPASRPVQVDDLTVDERTGEVLDSNPSRGTQFPGSSESAPVEVVHTETVKTTEKFDPKPPLTGGAAEQHNADTNCAVTGKALLTFEAYTYPAHRERMLDTWWPMGSRNIQPMHAALFNSSDVRRIAAAMYALADEMEAHHDYI